MGFKAVEIDYFVRLGDHWLLVQSFLDSREDLLFA